MEAFDNHQEEKKIAMAIKRQFDKDWSKSLNYLNDNLLS